MISAGISIAVILIVALHLAEYSFAVEGEGTDIEFRSVCLLADTGDDAVCNYAYAGESRCETKGVQDAVVLAEGRRHALHVF